MENNSNDNFSIEKPNLIVCEGKDDVGFFYNFLKSFKDGTDDRVQVFGAGSDKAIRPFIKNIHLSPRFDMLRSLTIIRDSDNKAEDYSKSIRGALKDAGFPVPDKPCRVASGPRPGGTEIINTGYALLPDFCSEQTVGELENLCLDILDKANPDSEKLLNIAENALLNAEKQGLSFKKRYKNKLHTYLSLSNTFVGLKLGESAKANAFNFAAVELEPLRKLLSDIIE